MNYGHFYQLNTEKTDLTQKIAVFDYKGVVSKESGIHAVYAIIIDDGVHFEYHFHNEEGSSHVHTDIAFLPFAFSIDLHERLSRIIEDCHDVTFPNEIAKTTSVKINNSLRINHKKSGGYSGLEVFNVGETADKGNIIRRMILDFFFDLEHSEVFQVSSFYSQVRDMLHSNSLTSAILARAEYYYQREQQQEKKYILDDFRAQLIYANDYTRAEREWVNVLCSEHADRLLAESAWLRVENKPSHVSKELNQLYRTRKNSLASCDYVNSIVFPTTNVEEKYKNKKEELYSRILHTAQRAQAAYLHHYDLFGPLRIWFDDGYSLTRSLLPLVGWQNLLLPRLMGAIIAAWLTIIQLMNSNSNFNTSNNSFFFCTGVIAFLLLYVYYEILNKNLFLRWTTICCRTFLLLIVAFIYSLTIGFIIMKVFEIKSHQLILHTIAVFIGLFIHMLFENKSITDS